MDEPKRLCEWCFPGSYPTYYSKNILGNHLGVLQETFVNKQRLPSVVKVRLYPTCVLSVMLFESETLPFKKDDALRIKRHDTRMARSVSSVRPEGRFLLMNTGIDCN